MLVRRDLFDVVDAIELRVPARGEVRRHVAGVIGVRGEEGNRSGLFAALGRFVEPTCISDRPLKVDLSQRVFIVVLHEGT